MDRNVWVVAIDLAIPAGFFFVSLTRGISAHQNRSFATAALAYATLLLGTAVLILLPGPYLFIGDIGGEPNLARGLSHVFAITGLGFGLSYVGHATMNLHRRYPPWLIISTGVAAVAVFALFISADLPVAIPHGPTFLSTYGTQPEVVALWIVTLAYELLVFIGMGSMTWRYAPHAGLPSTRLSLRIVALACAFGIGYATVKAITIIHVASAGYEPAWANHPLRHILFWYAPNILVVVGLAIPSVVAIRRRGPQHVAAWRDCRTIQPLWEDLTKFAPEMILSDPDAREPVLKVTILYRRIIEIADVVNRIRWYLPDPAKYRAEAVAQGLAGLNVEAYVRACQIADTLEPLRTGTSTSLSDLTPVDCSEDESFSQWADRTEQVSWETTPPGDMDDLAASQEFWIQVGRFYTDARNTTAKRLQTV